MLPVEDSRDDRVGVVGGEPADEADGVLVSADFRLGQAQRDGQLRDCAAFPPQDQGGVRVRVVAADGDVHFLEQGAQQLLAVLVGGGRGVPDGFEVVAEGQDGCPLVRGEGPGAGVLPAGELRLGVGQRPQGAFPSGFQAAGDEPVVRVDGAVAPLGPPGFVAGLLRLAAVLVQHGVVVVLELAGGLQAGVEGGGLQGGEERGGDGGVDGLPAGVHVPGAAAVDDVVRALAVVVLGRLGRAAVEDCQLAAAGPAGGQALQQGAALADRAGARGAGLRADVAADLAPGWPGRCPSR